MKLIPMMLVSAAMLGACTPAETSPEAKDTTAVSPPKSDITPEPPMLDDAADLCGAGKVGAFVGRVADDAVRAEVATLSGAQSIRWVTPGMMVTMDYRQNRLNVSLNGDNVITRVRCG